jgi:hypothetical protein
MAPGTTLTAQLSTDNDTVTSSVVQLGVILAFTIVIMLLVLWRRR